MRITGNIPKEVIYFPRHLTKVGFKWDDDEDTKEQKMREVRPAYCSDADNKNTIKTGQSWQSNDAEYEYVQGQHRKLTRAACTDQVHRINDPIEGIRVVSLEIRSEGGRAYKVITPDNYYFDLREDVLLDLMLNGTIKEGILVGKFIWGKVGSQMKLVRVGSELHQALIEADARHREGPLSKASFVIGQCYRNKKGDNKMFLGEFATLEVLTNENKSGRYGYRTEYDYLGTKEHKKLQVWLELPEYYIKPHNGEPVTDFSSMLKAFVSERSHYHSSEPDSELMSYHLSFVKESKMTDVDPFKIELPADYIQQIQDFIQKYWRMERKVHGGSGKPSNYDKAYYSKTFHLVPVGAKPVLKKEFEK